MVNGSPSSGNSPFYLNAKSWDLHNKLWGFVPDGGRILHEILVTKENDNIAVIVDSEDNRIG